MSKLQIMWDFYPICKAILPARASWILVEERRLWVKDKVLYYSQDCRQHELHTQILVPLLFKHHWKDEEQHQGAYVLEEASRGRSERSLMSFPSPYLPQSKVLSPLSRGFLLSFCLHKVWSWYNFLFFFSPQSSCTSSRDWKSQRKERSK